MAKKNFKKGVKNIIDSIERTDDFDDAISVKNENKVEEKSTTSDSVIIDLGSTFTVSYSKQVKAMLSKAVNNSKSITVKSLPVADIDVSFIQLLNAFRKIAEQRNIPVNWELQLSKEVTQLLQNTFMYDEIKPFLLEE